MIFVRGVYTSRDYLKYCYYYLRSSVYDYVNINQPRSYCTVKAKVIQEKELNYRVVIIENNAGRVAWKNCTGNYVNQGDKLCDIVTDDNSMSTIKSPIAGMIADRFVDEGVFVHANSLLCMIKVCDRPVSTVDRDSYINERNLYSKVSTDFDGELRGEDKIELEKIFGEEKRFRAKDFIQPMGEDDDDEERLDDVLVHKPSAGEGIAEDILSKQRQDSFEKYTPEEIQEEIRQLQVETNLSNIQQSSYQSNEFYKQLIDKNFTTIRKPLQIVYGSEKRPRFLQATMDLQLSSAFKFALNESGRNSIKFELRYLVLQGCLNAFRELPHLINSKDRSINITMGIVAGGKLNFPLIKNLERITDLKDKLNSLRASLIDGKEVQDPKEKRAENESLAITNEWDYGSSAGPSCLYVSPHANLSLNRIIVKPFVVSDLKSEYVPIMSTTLMFNSEKIEGQDALIFLNKVKESIENMKQSNTT